MSEPSSLYLKAHIKKTELDAFLSSSVQPPSKYSDWADWLATNQMHDGGIGPKDIEQIQFTANNVKHFLDQWLGEVGNNRFQKYDEESETFELSMLEFSDNYFDCIQVMHVLRELASYKSSETPDYLLIKGYSFGPEPDITIELTPKKSRIINETPPNAHDAFKNHMDERVKQLS
ncbi:MAG: hypothetical protein HRT45_05265 [Bdellovibrionales bacterium]|nr:hypothetical protein [Bdellovibrionales bacterium]